MSAKFDIVIVGAGLAGTSLAVALSQSPLKVALLDHAIPQFSDGLDQRIYAVSNSNQRFLTALGIWPRLPVERLQPVHDMHILGDQHGELKFSSYQAGVAQLAWIIESSVMHRELWETAKRQHNVTVLCSAQAEALWQNAHGVKLVLEAGDVLETRLLVGADGVNSWVRQQTAIEARVSPYQEVGVVANFNCVMPHNGVAYQWFMGDAGILALLPLPGQQVSMVWSLSAEQGKQLTALDPSVLAEKVTQASQAVLGPLEAVSAAAAFPLRLLRVDQPVYGRVALLGDAAHAIHPLSGHGINLGFQDAAALARSIQRMPAGGDIGDKSVLRRYARVRAEEPFLMQYSTHVLNRLFHHHNPLLSALRNHGMRWINHVPTLKQFLIRYATDLTDYS